MSRKADLARQLQKQLRSLRLHAELYDEGHEDEAATMAVKLRVIFHSTKSSVALVDHLRMRGRSMLSGACDPPGLTALVKVKLALHEPEPVTYRPCLKSNFRPLDMEQWWASDSLMTVEGRPITRRMIVLNAANKDGGAHCDAELEPFYHDMVTGASSLMKLHAENLIFPDGAPYDQTQPQGGRNTHLVLLRHIAHEVLATASYYRWLQTIT